MWSRAQQLTYFSVAETSEKLDQIEVNTQELLRHLGESDVKKSSQPDGIQSRVLKCLKYEAAGVLAKVHELALQTDTTRGL